MYSNMLPQNLHVKEQSGKWGLNIDIAQQVYHTT